MNLIDYVKDKSISPWVHTSDNCNISCPYCYVKNDNVMNIEIYNNIINLVKNSEAKHWHIRLAGGEPLLTFDIWKDFVLELRKLDNISIELLSNFQMAEDHHIDFANKNNVNVSISIDNDGKFKPLNDNIKEKIKLLKNPYIMTTLMPEYNNMYEMAEYIGKNKFGWDISTDYFNGDYNIHIIENMFNIIDILHKYDYDIFNNFSFNNINFSPYRSGCTAGREMFSIYCNGSIYKCQTLIYDNNCKIGNIKNNTYIPCIKKTNKFCANCNINKFCTGWCPLYHNKNSPLCELMKLITYKIMEVCDA